MKLTLAIILVAIAAALGLAACGGDDEDGQASAEQELCGSLAPSRPQWSISRV